jgi:hypothetical protein
MDLTLMRTLPKLDKDVKPGSFVTVAGPSQIGVG